MSYKFPEVDFQKYVVFSVDNIWTKNVRTTLNDCCKYFE